MQYSHRPYINAPSRSFVEIGKGTAEMVGLDGVNAAWLLTVHAAVDPDLQEKVLKLTKEHVRRAEVRSDEVALLTDDLLDGRGKPQRYALISCCAMAS